MTIDIWPDDRKRASAFLGLCADVHNDAGLEIVATVIEPQLRVRGTEFVFELLRQLTDVLSDNGISFTTEANVERFRHLEEVTEADEADMRARGEWRAK
jgi:hypothetical protein